LMNLVAGDPENRKAMWETYAAPVFRDAWKRGSSDEMNLAGLKGLVALVTNPDNAKLMRDTCLPLFAEAYQDLGFRDLGLEGMMNLACPTENAVVMFDSHLSLFRDAAVRGSTEDIKYMGFNGLKNLAGPKQNRVFMATTPELMEDLRKGAQLYEGAQGVGSTALLTLATILFSPETAAKCTHDGALLGFLVNRAALGEGYTALCATLALGCVARKTNSSRSCTSKTERFGTCFTG
jgi:hypothetical protein